MKDGWVAERNDVLIVIDAFVWPKIVSICSPFSALNSTFGKMDLATICVNCQVSWKFWSGLFRSSAFCHIRHSQTQTKLPILQTGTSSSQTCHSVFSDDCSRALELPFDLHWILGAIQLNALSVQNLATGVSRVSNDFKELQRIRGERLCSTRWTKTFFFWLKKSCRKIHTTWNLSSQPF